MRQPAERFDDAAADLGIVGGQRFRQLWQSGRGKSSQGVQGVAAAQRVAQHLDERTNGFPARRIVTVGDRRQS